MVRPEVLGMLEPVWFEAILRHALLWRAEVAAAKWTA